MQRRDKKGRFLNGIPSWNKGKTKETNDIVKEMSILKIGKKHSKKSKIKNRDAQIQKWKSKKYREIQTNSRKGKRYSPSTEFKKCMSSWNKGLNKKINKILKQSGEKSSKTKKRLFKEGKLIIWSKGKKLGKQSKETIKKRVLRLRGQKRTEKTKKKMRENRKKQKIPRHHTKPELKFMRLIKKYNLPFKYTGNSKFWI